MIKKEKKLIKINKKNKKFIKNQIIIYKRIYLNLFNLF